MNVKCLVLASLCLASSALPIQAAERYTFRVVDGSQALAAGELPWHIPELAGKPLIVLRQVDGTQWTWLLDGCVDITPCEFRLDDRGGRSVLPQDVAAVTHAYDVGLTRIDATRFELRCLRASCLVRGSAVEGKPETTVTLLRGKSIELPVESVIELRLTDDATP